LPDRGLTFAEIDETEKKRTSHRARAATASFLALEADALVPEYVPLAGMRARRDELGSVERLLWEQAVAGSNPVIPKIDRMCGHDGRPPRPDGPIGASIAGTISPAATVVFGSRKLHRRVIHVRTLQSLSTLT
jgi:hypothetical protein